MDFIVILTEWQKCPAFKIAELGFELRTSPLQAGTLILELIHQSFFVLDIF
jgi:hypothetical protein